MGYACPVCDAPQVDDAHLANHVAFTAMIHEAEHATWLDEHVDGWADMGPEELGPLVAEHAESVAIDAPEEDRRQSAQRSPPFGGEIDESDLSSADRAVLEEARDLTRTMYEDDDAETE